MRQIIKKNIKSKLNSTAKIFTEKIPQKRIYSCALYNCL